MPERKTAPEGCYWRGNTLWGRISIGGVEHRRSLRTAHAREAATRLKAWKAQIDDRLFGLAAEHTFKEAVVRWQDEVLPNSVRPAVAKRYLSSIRMLDPVFGSLTLNQVTAGRVSHYLSVRANKASNATLRRDLTALSRLMSMCVSWGWVAENPVRAFDRAVIPERRDPIQPPSEDDFQTVLRACPPGMAQVLRLLDQTGMREQEAVKLTRADVDWNSQRILLIRTKTSRPRALPWLTPGGDAGLVLPPEPPEAGQLCLFPSANGGPYQQFATGFGAVIRRVAAEEAAAGRAFRRFRVHDLRHRFALRWLQRAGSIYHLSRHLGHASLKTTERSYLAFLTAQEQDDVMRAYLENQRDAQKTAQMG